jgi:alkanesulfonate monooxygenase SsuD/methylene tetrahydromethanopterin reductase-like flavin-dependent oxidoreductase (luciferase family)
MNPAPSTPVPLYVGGHSEPALRRAARLGDGWLAAGAYNLDDAWHYLGLIKDELKKAGRENDPFDIYLSVAVKPQVEVYKRFEEAGVTDIICAPAMMAKPEHRVAAVDRFAEEIVAKLPS